MQRSWRQARRYRTRGGSLRTHCRTAASGQTWSTRRAARSVMRRPPQLGQNPRPLNEKATSRSSRQGAPEPRETTREPGAPTARTLRGGVGATRTGGTPGTHPRRAEAAPHRHAGTRTPRGTTRSDPARPGTTPTRRGRAAHTPQRAQPLARPGASPVPAPASRVSGPLHAPRPRRWPFARTPGPARFATRAYRIAPRQEVRHEASDDGTAGSGSERRSLCPGGEWLDVQFRNGVCTSPSHFAARAGLGR